MGLRARLLLTARTDVAAQRLVLDTNDFETPNVPVEIDAKGAGKQLKKTVRQMIQFSHQLRTTTAKRKVDASVRDPLVSAADTIRADAKSLRGGLRCPQ